LLDEQKNEGKPAAKPEENEKKPKSKKGKKTPDTPQIASLMVGGAR
jgi:hypothetical protein